MSNLDKKMLSIQQVSLITGLSKAVIRKWEDRYQTVTPKRLDNGHRVYTERDVQILLAVRKLADQGSSIQQQRFKLKHKFKMKMSKHIQ